MSRFYNMVVRIRGFDQQRTDRIKDAACDEWEFDSWNFHDGNLTAPLMASFAAAKRKRHLPSV